MQKTTKTIKKSDIIGATRHTNEDMKKFFKKAIDVCLAALIGCVNGFFGGGGGMLCVPFLEKMLKLPTKKAHATAIAIIAPITLFSAGVYLFKGAAPFPDLWYACGGVFVGGVLGALLLKKLPAGVVGAIFAVLMIIAGARLVLC